MESPFTVLIATVPQGIERAERSGGSWSVKSLLQGSDVRGLAASPSGTVFAGTQGNGIWRSDDAGATWSRAGLEGVIVKSVAICESLPEIVYAGTKPALVYRSEDGGTTWRELDAFRSIRGRRLWRQPAERPTTAYVQALVCSPHDPDVVVAGIEAGAVVRTMDGGRSWSNHLQGACRDCHSLHFHPDGKHVYAGGGALFKAGVAISADRGETWERPREGLDMSYGWAVAADPEVPEQVYLSLSPGPAKAHSKKGNAQAAILRLDREGSWHRLEGGLPQPLDHMPYAFLLRPASAGYLLAGLSNGDVWETADSGDTWRRVDTGLSGVERALVGI